MVVVKWIVCILVIVGALNWGLIGFFEFNLVDTIFGVGSMVSRVIYALVGLAGLAQIGALYSGGCGGGGCGKGGCGR